FRRPEEIALLAETEPLGQVDAVDRDCADAHRRVSRGAISSGATGRRADESRAASRIAASCAVRARREQAATAASDGTGARLALSCSRKATKVRRMASLESRGAMLSTPAARSTAAVSPNGSVRARIGRRARKYS